MADVYSTYEAKSKFSEVIRKVRAGRRVIIAYRGESVAEIIPASGGPGGLGQLLRRAEDEGVLSGSGQRSGRLRPLARRPGALARFLRSRE